ncbi:MAG TPA: DUF4142 domain-containing protein [Steroidobacteraceae bacterium]|nr:DUF4142 domain-containing protein [Steroidobacteraceae bacterium]
MKRLLIASLVVLPVCALAATDPDSNFYKHAAQGGISEVELGNLAAKKSHNPAVQEFGALMVKDHSAANEKLRAVAESKHMTLPKKAGAAEMATKAKLEVLSGSAFDKSYIKDMIKDHEQDIAEFKRESISGQDPDAKAFAAATLPTLEEHLQKIKSLASSDGQTASR